MRVDEAAHPTMTAVPTRAHDPRRVALGVFLAFAVAFTLTVALGFILELLWSSDGSTGLDSEVTRWMVDRRSQPLTDAMSVVTWLGSSWVVVPVAVVAVAGLLIVRQRWLAVLVALSVSGASVLSVLAKDVIERDRPPVEIRLQHSVSYSFPSGHSTQAAATYIALAIVVTVLSESRVLRAITWLVATVIVVLVGVSQRLSRHALDHRRTRWLDARESLGSRTHRCPRATQDRTSRRECEPYEALTVQNCLIESGVTLRGCS